MSESILVLIISAGLTAIITLGSVFLGAWIMFKATRQPGSGESFLASPKGEVFNIVNEGDDYADNGEPTVDEKNILEQTNRFLKVLGGA